MPKPRALQLVAPIDVRKHLWWARFYPPDQQETLALVLDDDEWHKLIQFQIPVAMWAVENRGAQNVEYAAGDPNRVDVSTLGPTQANIFHTSPAAVWVRCTSAASSPEVHLEYWYWSLSKQEKAAASSPLKKLKPAGQTRM